MLYIHPSFSINGNGLDREGVLQFAKSLIDNSNSYNQTTGRFLLDWFNKDTYVKVKTSGSTGKPKSIQLLKEHMINSALATGDYFNLKPKDKSLLCLSTNYIAGKMMLVRALVIGMDIYLAEPSSSPLEKTDIYFDFCAMVPLQVANSLSKIHQIKTLIIGGAPLPTAVRDKLQAKDVNAFETYGMTETITHIAVKPVHSLNDGDERYFETVPNVLIASDDRGCLVIKAPKVAKDTIVTNDVVEIVSGHTFQWLGRFDNVVNSGGVKLIPELIEKKIFPLIRCPFFLIGTPDVILGEKLVIVLETDKKAKDFEQLLASIDTLSKFQRPKAVFVCSEFCRTETGKIKRLETLQKILKEM